MNEGNDVDNTSVVSAHDEKRITLNSDIVFCKRMVIKHEHT